MTPPAARHRQPSPQNFSAPQQDFVLYDQPTPAHQHQRRTSAPVTGPVFNQRNFYANSAPSSSVSVNQRPSRPPVPLFNSNSSPSVSQQHQSQQQNSVKNAANMSTEFDMNLNGLGGGLDGATFGADIPWVDGLAVNTAFTSINAPSAASSSTRTISPKDIMNDPLASAPPSTAFTNLTSPDLNDSPFDSYETSPLFNENDMSATDGQWFSLFPDSVPEAHMSNALERSVSDRSMAQSNSSGYNSPGMAEAKRSVPLKTERSPSTPHSSGSGVKSRRRKASLPPIQYDPGDKTAMKRARNTLAARHSRQRKLDHVQTLEEQVRKLEAEKANAEREAAEWKEKYMTMTVGNLPV